MSVAIANPSVASSPVLIDGDDMFTNVNMKLERSLLPPGTLALSVNKRLRFGSADTRNGCRCLINLGQALRQSGVAIDRRITAGVDTPVLMLAISEAYGSGVPVFNPNTGALGSNVNFGVMLGFSPDQQFEIFPAFGKTLVVSGLGNDTTISVYEWDGSGAAILTANSTPGDTARTVIRTTGDACVVENRLVFRLSRYTVAWTLVDDYTRYDPVDGVTNAKRDVGGDIVRLFPTLQKVLLIVKSKSILGLTNFTGNLGESTATPPIPPPFSLEEINPDHGTTAPFAIAQVGADVYVLLTTHKGVFRLSQVLQDRLAVLPDPLTLAIQPFMDTINWAYANTSCVATVGEYVYFAVPTGNATSPNAMIVINGATNQLEGYDTFGASISIDRLFVLSANGVPQLYAVDHVNGRVFLMYDETLTGASRHDVFPSGNVAIADTMETRGYATQGLEGARTRRKKFKRARVAMATQSPSVTLTALSDGVNEQRTLTPAPITKSATKNYVFGTAGTDPAAAYQEDYASGTTQELIVRRSLEISGRWLSIRIANTQGTCNVRSVGVEARPLPKMAEAGA